MQFAKGREVNAETLSLLKAKGLSLDDIIDVAHAMERKADPTNADRQRAYRERRKAKNNARYSNGVTPPIEELHTPQTDISPDGENQSRPRARAAEHPLPADWRPALTPTAQKVVDGWPPGRLERELAAFTDHAADKGRRSKDWQAAFRTWISRADEMKPHGNRTRPAPASNPAEPVNAFVRVVARRQAERAASLAGQPDSWP